MANHYQPNAVPPPLPNGMGAPPPMPAGMGAPPPNPMAANPMANPMAMFANYPLKDIAHPHPHDVLMGRGGATNNHIGNSHWRQLVSANKELYLKLPKRQKQLLSKSIVHAVRSQNPPGRFLQKHPQTDLWYDVGDNRALEKTSQALREGAPKLKEKLKKQPAGVDSKAKGGAAAPPESASVSSDKNSASIAAAAGRSSTPPPPAAAAVAATSESSVGGSTRPTQTSLAPQTTAGSVGVSSVGATSTASSVATNTTARQNNLHPPTQANMMMAQAQQPFLAAAGVYPGAAVAGVSPQMHVANPYANVAAGPGMAGPPHQHHPNMYMGGPSMPPNIPPQGPVSERRKKKPPTSAGLTPPPVSEEPHPYSPQQHQPLPADNSYPGYDPGMYASGQMQQQQTQLHVEPQPYNGAAHPADLSNSPPHGGDGDMPAPPDGGLADHQGFSFGTIMSVDTQALAAAEPPMPIQPNEFSMGSLVLTDQELQLLASASGADEGQIRQSIFSKHSQLDKQQQPNEQQLRPTTDDPPRHVTFHKTTDEQQGVARGDNGEPLPANKNGDEMPAPVDLGLEPAGLSTGSMMSMVSAVAKLENAGLSFGSVMSFSVGGGAEGMPPAVDGGLEEIGASFGSMTIATNAGGAAGGTSPKTNGPSVPAPMNAPPPVWGAPALPTALDQQRSRGNLLECSDTESEDEQASEKISAQKSSDWEKLKATFEQQMKSGTPSGPPVLAQGPSYSSTTSNRQGTTLHIPTTNFARDVSQMSAMSAGDDDDDVGNMNNNFPHRQLPPQQQQQQQPYYVVPRQTSAHSGQGSFRDMPPPPPAAAKQESDQWEDFEATLLNRGSSLAAEDFNQEPHQHVPQGKKSGGGLLD